MMKDKTYSFMNDYGEATTNKVFNYFIFQSLVKISMMISGKINNLSKLTKIIYKFNYFEIIT
jgi:hypothetical protein